ncbi:MAG: tetratricopeptide repeat protein, partial [Candidatus Latescibacteria bacterium]|nr:tetratricopeptide repeat protein [Candidatus Latescibacterota bacterium]
MPQGIFNTESPAKSAQITRIVLQCCLGLIPFVPLIPFLSGIEFDAPDLPPRLFIFQVATFIISLSWLRYGTNRLRIALLSPILIYVFFLSSSALWALNPFRSVHLLAQHITLFCFFLTVSTTLNLSDLPRILRVAALAGGIVAFIGILEYHGLLPFTLPSTGKPSSTFMFRNLAAHYLITNIPFAGLLFFLARNNTDRGIASTAATFMFVFLLYTRTRGAWVGLFVSTVLMLFLFFVSNKSTHWQNLKGQFNRNGLYFAFAALCLVALLGPLSANMQEGHVQRFDEKKSDISSAVTSIFQKGGGRGRTNLWAGTIAMISDNPIVGVGLGNWEMNYPPYDYGELRTNVTPRRPHNDLLWIGSEIGLFGLIAYVSILVLFLYKAIQIWKTDTPHKWIILMCGITIFAMIGDGFFNFPYERLAPTLNFWFALAIADICFKPAATSSPVIPKHFAMILPIVLLGGIGITSKQLAFDYYYIKAIRGHYQQDHPQTERAAAKAIQFGPFNHQAFIIYGQSLRFQKKYAQAAASVRKGLRYHPNFPNAYNNLGHILDEMGQHPTAIENYRKSIKLLSYHHKAHYNMAIAYEKLGQTDSAIVAYQRALTITPYARAFHNLAGVYKKQGLIDSAQAYYKKSLSAQEPAIESFFNLGNLYTEQHKFAEAIQAYQEFIDKWQEDPKWLPEATQLLSEAYSGLGVIAEQKGNIETALKHYQESIQIWPQNAMGWYNLGNGLLLKNKDEEAIKAYQTAISHDQTHTNAYNNLGLVYSDRKQYPQAIEILEKARKIHPDSPII